VATHFGDNDRITSEITATFRKQQKTAEAKLAKQLEEQVRQLQESLAQATRRLVEDVHRVNFQQRLNVAGSGTPLHFSHEGLDMDLDLKDWGNIAFNIGSYAISGAGIGSVFPVIGTAIGAAVGVAVGLAVSVAGFFTGKEKRIRKAQQQVQEKIDEVRDRVICGLATEMEEITAPIHDKVGTAVLDWVDDMRASLTRPISIIDGQIAVTNKIRTQLEAMPYGTIHAI
jgi:gas vesicle protein